MEKTKIDKRWLKNHLTYSWWKYALLAAACVFGIDLLFTTTAYRPPEDKKIEFYACAGYFDAETAQEQLWPQFQARCPDQEELIVVNIDLTSEDVYTQMQFTTYLAAQQGDVLLLPVDKIADLITEGADYAFLDLQPYIDSGALNLRGIDPTPGIMTAENGESSVYAIPADSLTGLSRYYCNPTGSMLAVTVFSGNDENAVRFLDMLIELCAVE